MAHELQTVCVCVCVCVYMCGEWVVISDGSMRSGVKCLDYVP
jgi:hypothetical protein